MSQELSTAQRRFRSAMANLSAAVNVITTDGVGGRGGITVSAVCSVSDSPPTLLMCINQASYAHDLFRTNRRVAVNVLGAPHEQLAVDFAGMTDLSMAARFHRPGWEHGEHGVPVLLDAPAVLIGSVGAEYVRGSHTVMFVDVEHAAVRSDVGALVYFQRRFADVSPAPPAPAAP
ncbi:flavin reductase [Nocardiopsis coralliicola]